MTTGGADTATDAIAICRSVAQRLVEARLSARELRDYPGPVPMSLADAYARQDAAITLWPDEIAGWKVGAVARHWARRLGESRLLGPIFRRGLWRAVAGACSSLPVIPGGFAAVEAEYVFVLGSSAPAGRGDWSPAEAAELVGEMRVGIELAGSPLAAINDLGPAVIVSDFGNNAGLLLGEPIADWRARPPESLTCETYVNGSQVGHGSAASLPGGPLAALAFALSRCTRRGRALKPGDVVSTGACTGIHQVHAGDEARIAFAGIAELRCRIVSARADTPRPALR